MAQEWEYLVAALPETDAGELSADGREFEQYVSREQLIEDVLNVRGKAGWRVVALHPASENPSRPAYAVLERPKGQGHE